ncbi:hypothetical protein [Spirilliplanes yamanashiensis]|uniref:Uncharacterized protein n=1 Tax=Spirilliplanes yamanashiensis TaxID=42233 RepID=A0A8J4DIJ8_9ACTN|nr:hypothetical protein [Spirilliplanes yamanashiensis]MDP9817516.1 hypothetical protein [Spirilliplanes yamanashiensis]GIJ02831.1 hypothetical protein Sya03_21830 [Spirilliplanes yamanashiensis]
MSGEGGDKFTNWGKFAWDILKDNRPAVNTEADYVNAVPANASWADLSAPHGTNHFTWKWVGPGWIIRDFWFDMMLSWTYGARWRGGGAYITNAVVTVTDYSVGVGGYDIRIACRVGNIENGGSETAPYPRIPIDVSIGYSNWLYGGGGTCRFLVAGTGAGNATYDSSARDV